MSKGDTKLSHSAPHDVVDTDISVFSMVEVGTEENVDAVTVGERPRGMEGPVIAGPEPEVVGPTTFMKIRVCHSSNESLSVESNFPKPRVYELSARSSNVNVMVIANYVHFSKTLSKSLWLSVATSLSLAQSL